MNEVGNHKTQYEVIEEFKEKFNTRQKVLDFMVTLDTDRQRTMNFDEMFKFKIGDEVEVNKFVTDAIDIEYMKGIVIKVDYLWISVVKDVNKPYEFKTYSKYILKPVDE